MDSNSMNTTTSSASTADTASQTNPVYLRLKSGEIVNLTNYQEFHLKEMDNLERMYRFGAKVDFTVADHIRLGLMLCTTDEQSKMWMLHEVFEAVSGLDVPHPLKETWPWYVEQENRYLQFVYEHHGLDYSRYSEVVKPLDTLCYQIEEAHFFGNKISSLVGIAKEQGYTMIPSMKKFFPEMYL
jgi:hypothetical protein